MATFGAHQVLVVHQGIDHGAVDLHGGEALPSKLQSDFVARSQRDRALFGHDHTLVAHLRSQQGDVAAQARLQLALVDHAGGFAGAFKAGFAGHEVVVANAMGGDQQATHVDLGGGTKQDAVGVGQKHLAVGVDAAQDLAGLGVEHAVEGDRTGRGLHKIDLGLGAHVEAVPVQHRAVAGLVDVEAIAALPDGGGARRHLATLGQLGGRNGRALRPSLRATCRQPDQSPTHGLRPREESHRVFKRRGGGFFDHVGRRSKRLVEVEP